MWFGREDAAVRWVLVTPTPTAFQPSPRPEWQCINSSEAATWDWWGDCAGEAWAVGDSAAEEGLGWFNSTRAVHRAWTAAERASFTLGKGADLKNSSTLQEARCLTSAIAAWVKTSPSQGAVFNYFTDARNLRHLLVKGRSSKEIINLELRRIHTMCVESGLHIRAHWHPRGCWAGVLADCLSRGDFQGFREQSAAFGSRSGRMHPCL
jgi:hypothetical protein